MNKNVYSNYYQGLVGQNYKICKQGTNIKKY